MGWITVRPDGKVERVDDLARQAPAKLEPMLPARILPGCDDLCEYCMKQSDCQKLNRWRRGETL